MAQARHPSNESSCTVSEEMWLKALKGTQREKRAAVEFEGRISTRRCKGS